MQSVSPVPAVSGSVLTYTITVTNGGPATATGVTLNPGVPAGATGVIATATQGTCALVAGAWSCALGAIAAGGEVVATVTFVPPGAGVLVTTASVTATQADSVPANNSHVLAATIVPAAAGVNLSITKTDSLESVRTGGAFNYSIVVTNAGTTVATGVHVIDPIPAGITILAPTSTQGTCSIAAGQLQCDLGTLNPGQIVTITLPATAGAPGLVTNTAFVTSNEVDLTPLNNLASQQTMIVATAGCPVPAFSGPVRFSTGPAASAGDLMTGDLNHDGELDLVATLPSANSVSVLLGNGSGGFGAPTVLPAGLGALEGELIDLNGDGNLDLALEGLSDAWVVFGNAAGGFGTPVQFSFAPAVVSDVRVGDFNDDGIRDLIVAAMSGTNSALHVLAGNGTGGFSLATSLTLDRRADRLVVGDFNDDGNDDVVASFALAGGAIGDDFVYVLLGNGGGSFPTAPISIPILQTANRAFVQPLGDLNGDGFADLGLVEFVGTIRRLVLLMGNGAGSFAPTVLANAPSAIFRVSSGDLNGDGFLDLVSADFNRIGVQFGDGAGGFAAPVYFAAMSPGDIRIADFSGDSRPDIAVAGFRAGVGGVSVLLNGCGQPQTDLVVTLADAPDPAAEGTTVTVTATVTNVGSIAATNVSLTALPAGISGSVQSVSTTAGVCSSSNSEVVCSLGTIASGTAVTVTMDMQPATGGLQRTTVGATASQSDATPGNNLAVENTVINATGRTYIVTNTNDSGAGSLRQAIDSSNADAGDVDQIVFNIGAGGPQTIALLSPLSTVSQPVVIDGTTQPGFSGTPVIELNGTGISGTGLNVTGGNTTIRGLVINRFGGNGITLSTNGGNVVEGNFIGTNVAGTVAFANNQGVAIFSAGNRVGGTAAGARNIISGNTTSAVALVNATATGNLVQGNYIGTNVNGTAAVPNQGVQSGIFLNAGASSNSVIGNVVSGNTQHAVTVVGTTSNANVIQGNFIGTDPTGLVRVANGGIGVDIVSAPNTVIGGAGAARNIISGNGTGIQIRTGAAGTLVQNNYIGAAASGTAAISNGLGISINDGAGANIIGSTTPGLGNLISGNTGTGISLVGTLTTDNSIVGNFIGTGVNGAGQLSNSGDGININGATDTLIGGPAAGAVNAIAFNGGNGVNVTGGPGNRISTNVITGNGLLGINLSLPGVTPNDAGDADFGANNIQNFPVLTSAVDNGTTLTVQGTLNSLANTTFRIECRPGSPPRPTPGRGRPCRRSAFIVTRSTTPLKSPSAPIGS